VDHGVVFSFGCCTRAGAFAASGALALVIAAVPPTGLAANPDHRSGSPVETLDARTDTFTLVIMSPP
jgi:hypothetical protein